MSDVATPLAIVSRRDPVLWSVAAPVTDINAQVLPYLDAMRELMHLGPVRAISLAAPQVGLPFRFFIAPTLRCTVAINPVILARSPEMVSAREGCMSWNQGKTTVFVRRHQWVELRWTDAEAKEHTTRFRDRDARIVQHECDHLDGKCIFSNA